jgi:hypothetical protein
MFPQAKNLVVVFTLCYRMYRLRRCAEDKLNDGGMLNYLSSLPQIRNSLIWGNGADNISDSSSTPSYTYSLVAGLNPSGIGNIDDTASANDPMFVDPVGPASTPTTDGDYHLLEDSPVIDKGSNSFYNAGQTPNLSAITTDRDGNPRFNGIIDMGAYER